MVPGGILDCIEAGLDHVRLEAGKLGEICASAKEEDTGIPEVISLRATASCCLPVGLFDEAIDFRTLTKPRSPGFHSRSRFLLGLTPM